ncbi:MAG: chorismate-binding protein [Candidatus Thermoplasmatota archaeon]|nr:chorismate-binding protein [Candidatus Thermoplasmatota archaeon]
MNRNLYRKVESLLKGDSDFAYFCRFRDNDRISGEEFLFETEIDPVTFNGNSRDTIRKGLSDMVESLDDGELVPTFISYDFVSTVFGLQLRNRSKWPTVSAIMPSKITKGQFTRAAATGPVRKLGVATMEKYRREELAHRIAEVRERIREGELLQVVLSNRFGVSPFDSASLLNYFMTNDLSRYVYMFRFNGHEVVGSSPESVFVRNGVNVTIDPIAGTRNRDVDANNDTILIKSLNNDVKEICEHRMLVDLARNDLARICSPGTIRVTRDMIPEKFYSVIHLVSQVKGTVRENISPYDLLASIFPAGTVSGAPKRRALEIIDETEDRARGPYSGSVGLLGKEIMDMALTIRSAFQSQNESFVQAGAGIVKDSVPDTEVDEMIAKADTVIAGGLKCEY